MIIPLTPAVDDAVYRAVELICGEETALQLCYEDKETYEQVKEFVEVILNGAPMGIPVKEVAS
jgi:hypothetical protein